MQVVAGSGVRGWLDASIENNNWLKFIRSSNQPAEINMQHFLHGGQVHINLFSNIYAPEKHYIFVRDASLFLKQSGKTCGKLPLLVSFGFRK